LEKVADEARPTLLWAGYQSHATVEEESKAVQFRGSGRNIPEFDDVLSAEENRMPIAYKFRNSAGGLRVERMIGLGAPKENICINEDTQSVVVAFVDTFATDCMIREGRSGTMGRRPRLKCSRPLFRRYPCLCRVEYSAFNHEKEILLYCHPASLGLGNESSFDFGCEMQRNRHYQTSPCKPMSSMGQAYGMNGFAVIRLRVGYQGSQLASLKGHAFRRAERK
jgi:hypothetical protein